MDDDDRVLAAEYVLGLLSAAEQRAFEARLTSEPALRDEVAARSEDFAAMTTGIEPVEPPRRVWDGINARLFSEEPRVGLLERLGIGRILAGAALATVLVFGAMQLGVLMPETAPEFRAELSGEDALRFRADYDADTGSLVLTRLGGTAAAGRSYEFWLIAGGNAPVSVMVWPRDAESEEIMLPAPIAAALPGGTLAISDEPEGGSPTGAPTGAVLAAAEVQPI
ncbi:anti-sigma factor [Oceanicola sp. 22II-s10i]|uniref:anti-sigma factor n=1 Tax=Oceanicola sp. 22II-s10i TaxID=1317116 RepID=UPI001C3C4ED4|nr:anti-sigma factor [Oceanicola sp. 22II-s10i]